MYILADIYIHTDKAIHGHGHTSKQGKTLTDITLIHLRNFYFFQDGSVKSKTGSTNSDYKPGMLTG